MSETSRIIEIYDEELPPSWRWSPERFVGGTHEMIVEVASCLAKRGHEVRVLYDGPPMEWAGVSYLPRELYQAEDVLLAVNSVPDEIPATNAYWTSLVTDRAYGYRMFQHRIVLSAYHQSLFKKDSAVIPLACWPDRFKGGVKEPLSCLYSSSPDRGGEYLAKIWPEVKNATGARLITSYNMDTSEAEMEERYKSAQFWLHPCLGVELYCIAARKALAAGCIPVFVPDQALATTIPKGIGVRTTHEGFKDDLIRALLAPPPVLPIAVGSWDDTATMISNLLRI